MTVNYQYDSDNRLIQFSVTYTGDFSANNYVVDYVWDGLTANYSYSGALQNTGYIIYNSTGYMLEVYGNNGGSESTQLYEYNCNTSTLLDLNKSKTLLSTINLLGQETVQKGFNIEIYNDGSIEKKYLIK